MEVYIILYKDLYIHDNKDIFLYVDKRHQD